MSSLAQEESRSLSENVTWGVRKRFADGKYHIVYKGFLGYKAGKGGNPEIDENEAPIIRFIYLRFLEGWTCGDIARKLEKSGIKTVRGKSHWKSSTIAGILTNEKYYTLLLTLLWFLQALLFYLQFALGHPQGLSLYMDTPI